MKKLYIVRKYIMAENVADATAIERRFPADDVWLDDDWKTANLAKPPQKPTEPMGFQTKNKKT